MHDDDYKEEDYLIYLQTNSRIKLKSGETDTVFHKFGNDKNYCRWLS